MAVIFIYSSNNLETTITTKITMKSMSIMTDLSHHSVNVELWCFGPRQHCLWAAGLDPCYVAMKKRKSTGKKKKRKSTGKKKKRKSTGKKKKRKSTGKKKKRKSTGKKKKRKSRGQKKKREGEKAEMHGADQENEEKKSYK